MTEPEPAPFPRSYWVSHPWLLAGCYPCALDSDLRQARARFAGLLDAGVRLIVNLMEENELGHGGAALEPYVDVLAEIASEKGVTAHMDRFAIPDMGVPTPEQMTAILDAVDRSIDSGLPVYVHCLGGRGRTGTVVGCWLARHGIASGDAALRRIAELRAGVPGAGFLSPETDAQREMVRGWGGVSDARCPAPGLCRPYRRFSSM